MDTIWLRCRAPFAAYRPMQAGSLRATLPVITYSAAWGLALNLAGIETRSSEARSVTGISPDAPCLRIALGLPGAAPGFATLYQQLHGYPIGTSSENLQPGAKGSKYHIAPARRELLVGLDVVLGIQGELGVLRRITDGLRGSIPEPRYGLPFAGDNNLLFDDIEVRACSTTCRWYVPLDTSQPPQRGAARLTQSIDREDSGRTRTVLVVPDVQAREQPPENAWQWTPREPTR
jgi:CRISPR-associated protein Cas5t